FPDGSEWRTTAGSAYPRPAMPTNMAVRTTVRMAAAAPRVWLALMTLGVGGTRVCRARGQSLGFVLGEVRWHRPGRQGADDECHAPAHRRGRVFPRGGPRA